MDYVFYLFELLLYVIIIFFSLNYFEWMRGANSRLKVQGTVHTIKDQKSIKGRILDWRLYFVPLEFILTKLIKNVSSSISH